MKSIFNLFSRPFPDSTKQDHLIQMSIGTGLFVSVFLLVFQPFGIAEVDILFKFWKVAGFGMVTGAVLFFYFKYFLLLFPTWHQGKNWTVGKEILSYVISVTFIGIGNSMYSIFIGINAFSLSTFWGMLYSTFWVGIFPVTFFVILSYIY